MIRISFKILSPALLVVWFVAGFCFAKYDGGGTAEDPYLIYTAEEMNEISAYSSDWDKHFALMADINMGDYSGDQFIIGDESRSFTGVFDGRGHEIYQFTYSSSGVYIGLFGVADQPACIKNLGIVNPGVFGFSSVGALVGQLIDGTIENCWVRGGYIGAQFQGSGALAGTLSGGTVLNCYTDDVFVQTVSDAGGLAAACDARMENCFAASPISASSGDVGALVGTSVHGSYSGCFWDSTVNSSLTGIGNITDPEGVIGETTTNMQKASTFVNAGWDIVTPDNQPRRFIWRMCTDGVDYPRLSIEYLQSDFVCPDGVDILDLAALAEEWQLESFEVDVDFHFDRRIDFLDWAQLASAWQSTDGQSEYNEKYDIAPETPDGMIDEKDVAVFVDYWLAEGDVYFNTDIEPYGGDGVVDFYDYAVFSSQYQQGD